MFKRFDYLYAWQGSIIALVFFTLVAFLIPSVKQTLDLTTVMTISTFLFGIIAAFAISERYARFQDLRKLVASETSALTFIYTTSLDIDKKYSDELKQLIDDYLVRSMDFELREYEAKLNDEFIRLERAVDRGRVFIKEGRPSLFDKMIDSIRGLSTTRKEIGLSGKDRMEFVQWVALDSLAVVTIFSTLSMLNGNTLARMLAAIFCFTIVLILLILRDLNNDRWHVESISFIPFTEVWDALGLPHYYHKIDIDTKRAKIPKGVSYRVGLHKYGDKPIIKLVNQNK